MSEDTLTPRNETIPGLVELVTLNVGDEFQAGDTGGTVVWKVNKGSARAVDVLYDGHSKPISIAPSLKVMVRKRAEHKLADAKRMTPEEFFQELNDVLESSEPITLDFEDACTTFEKQFESTWQDNSHALFTKEDLQLATTLPIPEDAAKVVLTDEETGVQETCWVVPPAPEDLPPAPKPIPSPTIRVIRLTADEPKTMPVMVQPPLPTCKFDLTLNAEQIRLLTFDSVKQMFYKGLYFGWTRETFFEVAKAKFPHLKAGQNYESCLAQIRLYHCSLKNAGRMQ